MGHAGGTHRWQHGRESHRGIDGLAHPGLEGLDLRDEAMLKPPGEDGGGHPGSLVRLPIRRHGPRVLATEAARPLGLADGQEL